MLYYGRRTIKINRQQVSASKNKGKLYLIAYQDNITDAMKDLSSSAFKCYMVLLMNKDQFNIDYSPEYISSITNNTKITGRKGPKELCEKNYLVQVNDKHYNFFQRPPLYLRNEKEQKRIIVDKLTDNVYIYTYKQLRAYVNEQTANKLWQEAKVYEQE